MNNLNLKLIICLLLVIVSSGGFAQVQQIYVTTNSKSDGNVLKIREDATGNVIVLSRKDPSFVGGGYHWNLAKYTAEGNVVFNQTYAAIANALYTNPDMTMDSAGNIYVVSVRDTGALVKNTVINTVKFNSSGLISWEKDFDYNNILDPTCGGDQPLIKTTEAYSKITYDPMGNKIVVLFSSRYGSGACLHQWFTVLKYDLNGNISLNKRFGDINPNSYSLDLASGQYFIASDTLGNSYIAYSKIYTSSYPNTQVINIAKINGGGTLIYDTLFYQVSAHDAYSIKAFEYKKPLNECILSGKQVVYPSSNNNLFVAKVKLNTGTLSWDKWFINEINNTNTLFKTDAPGNIYVQTFAQTGEPKFYKYNTAGALAWSFQGSPTQLVYGFTVNALGNIYTLETVGYNVKITKYNNNVLSYSYTLPANIYLRTPFVAKKNHLVFPCSVSTLNAYGVTRYNECPTLKMPRIISVNGGDAKVCPGDSRTYSIAATGNFLWTVPTGATINSGQGTNTITVTFNQNFTHTDTIYAAKMGACGAGPARKYIVRLNTVPPPTAIVGDEYNLCGQTHATFSIPALSGVNYLWAVPAGATINSGQGTNAITVDFTNSSLTGMITLSIQNNCLQSFNRSKKVKLKPSTPGEITGLTSVCAHQSGVTYTIEPVAGATEYRWEGPAGSHLSDGTTTSTNNVLITNATSITLNFATNAGMIKVAAKNACGSTLSQTLNISINCRIGENENTADFYITPNPCSNCVIHLIDNPKDLLVTDVMGRICNVEFEKSSDGYIMQLNEQPAGVYFVHNIQNGIVKRFVKY